MLSILIPTFNYDITELVGEIISQTKDCKIKHEILVYDDGSNSPINELNSEINNLDHCTFIPLKENIGRSAIRNLLAKKANYEFLLFLDSDVKIFNSNFLRNYLNSLNQYTEIIYGGIIYQKAIPKSDELLRWTYGNKREALKINTRIKKPHLTFLTLNFIIKKNIFNKIMFNENIPNLRNEDLLFAMDAKRKNILVKHIDNPIMHLGIENSKAFLLKTKDTLKSFIFLTNNGLLDPKVASITRTSTFIEKTKLTFLFNIMEKLLRKYFEKNLLSKKPSLLIFDLYRLCYYLKLKNNN